MKTTFRVRLLALATVGGVPRLRGAVLDVGAEQAAELVRSGKGVLTQPHDLAELGRRLQQPQSPVDSLVTR
jgi:hypothetical protein